MTCIIWRISDPQPTIHEPRHTTHDSRPTHPRRTHPRRLDTLGLDNSTTDFSVELLPQWALPMRPYVYKYNSCTFCLQGNFDKAVDILKPIRYKLDLVGGSRAQVSTAWVTALSKQLHVRPMTMVLMIDDDDIMKCPHHKNVTWKLMFLLVWRDMNL